MDPEAFINWQQVAAWTFGAWAVMLPLAVGLVTRAVNKFISRFDDYVRRFNDYVIVMEARMTIVETNQKNLMHWVERQEKRQDGGK